MKLKLNYHVNVKLTKEGIEYIRDIETCDYSNNIKDNILTIQLSEFMVLFGEFWQTGDDMVTDIEYVDDVEDNMDIRVDNWHNSDSKLTLHDYLGMSWVKYNEWVHRYGGRIMNIEQLKEKILELLKTGTFRVQHIMVDTIEVVNSDYSIQLVLRDNENQLDRLTITYAKGQYIKDNKICKEYDDDDAPYQSMHLVSNAGVDYEIVAAMLKLSTISSMIDSDIAVSLQHPTYKSSKKIVDELK